MAIVQLFLLMAAMQFLLRHQILIVFVSAHLQHAIDLFATDLDTESLLLLLYLGV